MLASLALVGLGSFAAQPAQAKTAAKDPQFCVYESTNYGGKKSCLPQSGVDHSPGGPVLNPKGGTVRSYKNQTSLNVCLKYNGNVVHRIDPHMESKDVNVFADGMWLKGC